ncbi:GTP cyclohydrolase, FolE2/MptA family [Streptomyces sp. NPDC002838]|uniref:GTP cyclohydrolase, FolE2/MptA family n=1 Tax=Streptomyces sp. NPDC002838 TaxID=3154436 RepID=UPI0033341E34
MSAREYREISESDLLDAPEFLDSMTDVANQRSDRRGRAVQAGIDDQDFAVTIGSFVQEADECAVTGSASLTVTLPAGRRGAHMSRFIESVYEVSARPWPTFAAFVDALTRDVAERQCTEEARVRLVGRVLVPRRTPVSKQLSHDRFMLLGDGRMRAGEVRTRTGLEATVITACPCTQAYSWGSTALTLAETHGVNTANQIMRDVVPFTHSQRATATVWVDGEDGPSTRDCYAAMCEGAHVVHELLKRPDEHYLVQRSHTRPQFSEDVVRDVVSALLERSDAAWPGSCRVRVESRAVESIHSHAVHSVLEGTLDDFRTAE